MFADNTAFLQPDAMEQPVNYATSSDNHGGMQSQPKKKGHFMPVTFEMLSMAKPGEDDTIELDGHAAKEICIVGKTVDREKSNLRQDIILNDSTNSMRTIFY